MQRKVFLPALVFCFINQASTFWFGGLGFGKSDLKCGGSSSAKNLVISSPAIVPLECSYTLMAFSSSVCQIRVDFDVTLAPPSLPADDNQIDFAQCVDDVMFIGEFRLCGRDSNQHLYIPLDRANAVNSVEIRFILADRLSRAGLVSPQWKLRINQLQCPPGSTTRGLSEEIQSLPITPRTYINDGFLIAPMGCSQFYPHPSGLFTSFNFNSGNGIYPGDMNYAICFRRSTSNDQLSLKAFQFQLGELIPDIPSVAHVGEVCVPKLHTEGRSEDYVLIPQAEIMGESIRSTYFCGNSIQQAPVICAESGFGFTYTIM